jgi:signal transduction histidine kinase
MDMVLTRSLLYSALGGLFLGFALLIGYYGGEWLFPDQRFRPVGFAVRLLLLLFAFHFLFHALRDGLQRKIEHSFFHHRLRGTEILERFSQTLPTWTNLEDLSHYTLEKIAESLHLSSATILLADGTQYSHGNTTQTPPQFLTQALAYMTDSILVTEEAPEGPLKDACSAAQINVIVALTCREQQAWLLLGEKRSGRPFFSRELTLLEAACGQLAMAIDNLLLIQSKLALERTMQHREKLAAIGQLAATVAHEIRNPITGAKCLLQQVEEELNGNTQGKEYIQLALEDLARVEESVSQLLTFARREEFQFTEQDVSEVIRTTVERFTTQMQDKTVAVEVLNTDPVWAAIDEEKIRRTVLNLLVNASDAVNGNGRIEVGVAATGPEVEIRVSDNGHGLSAADQQRIFEPFFTTKEKGTGLGLAIAKKIIEGHGGRIAVASTAEHGTTFTAVLPRHQHSTRVAA